MLGPTQEAWLIEGLRRSRATWKVISIDQPLSAPASRTYDLDGVSNGDDGPPLGREPEIARVLSAIKRHGIRNVVWITADVHYTAANHYSPERASFTDFEPFWEFISGPLHCSPFTAKPTEPGPDLRPAGALHPRQGRAAAGQDRPAARQPAHRPGSTSPPPARLTVRLYDGGGTVLWQKTLDPDEVAV
ncbi:phosphodiesterase [Nocardioides sp. W3-2-3]|nr:phosphodiesterase [Nocardioides convexus]